MSNIIKKSFIGLVCLFVGIFLAVGATYVYATWNDAKTSGGELSDTSWDALITQLELMDAKVGALAIGGGGGSPTNWTCRMVSGGQNNPSTATCALDERLITGGCQGIFIDSPDAFGYPYHGNSWRCDFGGPGGGTARAYCCK